MLQGRMIDIYNLYENVSYKFDEDKRKFTVSWDKSNKDLCDLMENEVNMIYDQEDIFTNSSFIEFIKESVRWEEGQTIHFNIICNSLRVTINILDNVYQDNYTFLELNGDGYLYIREFRGNCPFCRDETEYVSRKKKCYYNDLVADEKGYSYILK
jgi:hypothetical protein